MTVTKVVVTPCRHKADNSLRAIASVFFDGEYVVNGIQVFKTVNGDYHIQFPNLPGLHRCGTERFAFTPFTQKARHTIEEAVLEKYQSIIDWKERSKK